MKDPPHARSRSTNGLLSPEHSLLRLPGDSSSGQAGAAWQRRPGAALSQLRTLWPMVLLLGVAGIVLLSSASHLHSSTSSSSSAHPEHLAQTIAQLSENQEAMMHMLQKLAANSTGAGAGASTSSQRDAQAGGAAGGKQQEEQVPAAFAALPALTTLHNEVLRASHKYNQHRRVMLDTLQQLVHLEPAAATKFIGSKLAERTDSPMALFTFRLYKLLLSTGKLIPCREDSTLVVHDPELAGGPNGTSAAHHHGSSSHHLGLGSHLPHLWTHHNSGGSGSSSAGTAGGGTAGQQPLKYFFATNLRDNSINMPQYILSLLQTLLRLPLGSTFVSAYESNSDDGAHGWVDVLQLALNVIGTPSRLVTRGMLVRLQGSNRIQHLARVRNMALTPLYQHYAAARDAALRNSSSSSSSLKGGDSVSSSSTGNGRHLLTTPQLEAVASVSDAANLPPGVLPWDPDFIVFVNDAYFCWGQVMRLLNYQADITCGMDFWQNPDATMDLPFELATKTHKPKPHMPAELKLERSIDSPHGPDQRNPIVFYDVWVARDLSGSKFWWNYPYVHDSTTTKAASQGLPFRASCCWNGLAVLKAAPFKAGLRIRPPMEGECQGSECTIVCNDFARLGYDYVVVDAGVQFTYDWSLAREMSALGIEGIGQTTWQQAKAAGIAGRSRKPAYENVECCGLKSTFTQWVNFHTDCYREDVLAANFTQSMLHGS